MRRVIRGFHQLDSARICRKLQPVLFWKHDCQTWLCLCILLPNFPPGTTAVADPGFHKGAPTPELWEKPMMARLLPKTTGKRKKLDRGGGASIMLENLVIVSLWHPSPGPSPSLPHPPNLFNFVYLLSICLLENRRLAFDWKVFLPLLFMSKIIHYKCCIKRWSNTKWIGCDKSS